jgi:hypothetical protein
VDVPGNIFSWLDRVHERPGMYIGDGSLRDLETLVHGYCAALDIHGIDERVPNMVHFGDWLRYRTLWSLSCGWASAILTNAGSQPPLEVFFDWLFEFRKLTPRHLCSVATTEENEPTGRRVVIGKAGRIQRPERIDIVQYYPEPLFFLQFHVKARIEPQQILFDNGKHATSKEFAMRWVEEEMNVPSSAWREPPN